jgi:HPt (histidine-containing phosphotransfer) domain-containing protein
MTSPAPGSFLDFFVLEASEYVEQIDGLLAAAADAAPDPETLQRVARALRGSATMAKLASFAELASAVEGVGRSLRQGAVSWEPGLRGAVTAAVDDLKLLVRAARTWSAGEDQRAMQRIAELGPYLPAMAQPTATSAATTAAFFASESNNIAAELDALIARPTDRDVAARLLQRVRALRGVASAKDVPGLAECAEAIETTVRPAEQGESLSHEAQAVFRAAAELLRTISSGLASGSQVTSSTPQYTALLTAMDSLLTSAQGADRVIPIAQLFYDDAGPHVISTAPNPPTTAAQRFRMEVVSLGEHLQRVIADVRNADDEIRLEHSRADLARALRAIRATAASFGQKSVAAVVESHLARTGVLDAAALDAIETFATSISPAATAPTPLGQPAIPPRLSRTIPPALASVPATSPPPPSRMQTPPIPMPPVPVRPAASRAAGPSPLDATIATFDALSRERFAEPVAFDDEVVPVDALLYRGKAALDRAIELRDELRRSNAAPSPGALEELYDLLELARVD